MHVCILVKLYSTHCVNSTTGYAFILGHTNLPINTIILGHLTFTDVARYSVVRFNQTELVEKMQDASFMVSIPLWRFGNLDQTSRIRCTLVSGTAIEGVDFWKPQRPQRVMFPVGSQNKKCSVLLFHKKAELHERKNFTVRLEAEDSHTVISTESMPVHIEARECRSTS